jgi:phosphopantothenoylcysteine decarboxylase/phosphopantothenate--cysteine ligase
MGLALANELASRGADVSLILGPGSPTPDNKNLVVINVETAEQMYNACMKLAQTMDIIIMAAAVADYTPAKPSEEKLKKKDGQMVLELTRTKDILKELGLMKKPGQVLVGFALENRNEEEYAQSKLNKKNADLIVLNSLRDAGAGFGYDTNKITIFLKNGAAIPFEQKPKQQVAKDIVDTIAKIMYA